MRNVKPDDDEAFARAHCAVRDYKYLSHETYKTMAMHEVRIAVAAHGDRFEITVSR